MTEDGGSCEYETWGSFWLTSDAGTVHWACGPVPKLLELKARYENAQVAQGSVGACCKREEAMGAEEPIACAFGSDRLYAPAKIRIQFTLAYSLARKEGRTHESYEEYMTRVDTVVDTVW